MIIIPRYLDLVGTCKMSGPQRAPNEPKARVKRGAAAENEAKVKAMLHQQGISYMYIDMHVYMYVCCTDCCGSLAKMNGGRPFRREIGSLKRVRSAKCAPRLSR